jgi:hypothetical protein
MNPLYPNAAELKVLKSFQSTDEARTNLCTIWIYNSDGGCTHMATNGHVIVVRRSGTHCEKLLVDIGNLPANAERSSLATTVPPRSWASFIKAPNCEGKNLLVRGIDPAYVGMIANVERVAGRRAALDYVPIQGESKKDVAEERRRLIDTAISRWSIGCGEDDGWYWSMFVGTVCWEGVIMPRRIR